MSLRWVVAAAVFVLSLGAAQAREMPLPRWDWVLGEEPDVDALIALQLDYVGLDAFDVSAEQVAALRKAGIHVWCYVSAGTIEDWRPDLPDYEAAHDALLAAGRTGLIAGPYAEWAGERWLDPRALDVLIPLIEARLALCAAKEFDMVEFDNVDGYENDTGLALTEGDALAFALALADAAHRAGLAPLLKNVPDLAAALEPHYDGYLMEECVLWEFCDAAQPFIAAGKPALDAEYPSAYEEEGVAFDVDAVCTAGGQGDVSVLVKTGDLTMEAKRCP